MIDVNKQKNQAQLIDNAATNVNSVIGILEDSLDYLSSSSSNRIDSFKTNLETKLTILRQIKKDLNNAANTIRTTAQEIYNNEKAEEERKKREAELAEQNNG